MEATVSDITRKQQHELLLFVRAPAPAEARGDPCRLRLLPLYGRHRGRRPGRQAESGPAAPLAHGAPEVAARGLLVSPPQPAQHRARRFNIPFGHFFELIQGMEMDLTKNRYETFEELERYCYLVASSVGLMCRQIFGYRNESTREYAINLGIALQLTNILRDVKDDAERGRIYLPREDLARFGYTEDDILHQRYSPAFVELMRFECDRARATSTRPGDALRTRTSASSSPRASCGRSTRIPCSASNPPDTTSSSGGSPSPGS